MGLPFRFPFFGWGEGISVIVMLWIACRAPGGMSRPVLSRGGLLFKSITSPMSEWAILHWIRISTSAAVGWKVRSDGRMPW